MVVKMYLQTEHAVIAETLDKAKAVFVLNEDGSISRLRDDAKTKLADCVRAVPCDALSFDDCTQPAPHRDLIGVDGTEVAEEVIAQQQRYTELIHEISEKRSRFVSGYLSLLSGLSMLISGNPRADIALKQANVGGYDLVNKLTVEISRLLMVEKEHQRSRFFKAAWRHQVKKGKR